MTIAQLDPLRIEVVLPARLFGSIQAGDTAEIEPELESGESLIASVEIVDHLLDSHSGTFGVLLVLEKSGFAIPAGQKCRVDLETESVPDMSAGIREEGGLAEDSVSLESSGANLDRAEAAGQIPTDFHSAAPGAAMPAKN